MLCTANALLAAETKQRALEGTARNGQLRTSLRDGANRCALDSSRWASWALVALLALGALVATIA
eukprot:3351172-Alexandrium_andersonii.AAC.1